MPENPPSYFSAAYAQAREKFLAAAKREAAKIETVPLPYHTGPDGEALAMDFAVFGPERAEAGLVLVSGTHGVEGFCGSACETGHLREGHIKAYAERLRVVIIHAHNPHGFAWLRRVNEDNVDLNRNYIDHLKPYPQHPTYDALKNDIAPQTISGTAFDAATARLKDYSVKHGAFALQQAITTGQYRHPTGLYYGGTFPTWSNRTMSDVLPRLLAHQRRVALIDYHSGLGPFGFGELICEYEPGSPGDRTLKAWFGPQAKSTRAGESVSADLTGTLDTAIPRLLPHAETIAFAIEYGTIPPMEVFSALRADNWLHLHGDLKSEQGRAIKAEIRRAFYQDSDEWKRLVWTRSLEVVERTARGLAELVPA